MTALGFRICPAPAQVPPELLRAFDDIPVAPVSDVMGHLHGIIGLRKYHREGKLLGTAFTVKTHPGDSLMVHKALELARAGDVLVIDGGGYLTHAVAGELMLLYAQRKGMAGFVVDGAIRDVAAYRAVDFPCYARAHTYLGPYKEGPGEINVPVSIGGLIVHPGDFMLGDEDGVLAFSPSHAREILTASLALCAVEEERRKAIAENLDDKGWVDAILRAKGVVLS
jgi:RraA family protein